MITLALYKRFDQPIAESKPQFTLSVGRGGSGSVPGSGIDCGKVCSAKYTQGTTVTLTAGASDTIELDLKIKGATPVGTYTGTLVRTDAATGANASNARPSRSSPSSAAGTSSNSCTAAEDAHPATSYRGAGAESRLAINAATTSPCVSWARPRCGTAFSALVVGSIAQTRRRTVCGMLLGVGLARVWHHARAHRLFAAARWCADAVGLAMLDLIVDRLLTPGSAITVVVDYTLFKRSGRKVFGVFWHHDGAAKGPKPIGLG